MAPSNQQKRHPKLTRITNVGSHVLRPASLFHRSTHIPPFQGMGLGLGLDSAPVEQLGGGGGLNLERNNVFEHSNSNSQMSSINLGLSLNNNKSGGLLVSLRNSFLPNVADGIYGQLEKQDAELSRYLAVQGEQLRKTVLEKFLANQVQTLSYVDKEMHQKIHEKEVEVEDLKKKNEELHAIVVRVCLDAAAWKQSAESNEAMNKRLKYTLERAQRKDNDMEGCGDSELLDDSASCYDGRPKDFHLFPKDVTGMKELMSCKVCRLNKICVLLLPCKHLCLCSECDSKISTCPVCDTPKYIGMDVYI